MKLIGAPVSTNTIYQFVCRGRFPAMYVTDRGLQLKAFYQVQAKLQHKDKPFEGDLDVSVKLFFKDHRRRDIDNYSKILLDSLTGILWNDDSQITRMQIEKHIDQFEPRIELNVKQSETIKDA